MIDPKPKDLAGEAFPVAHVGDLADPHHRHIADDDPLVFEDPLVGDDEDVVAPAQPLPAEEAPKADRDGQKVFGQLRPQGEVRADHRPPGEGGDGEGCSERAREHPPVLAGRNADLLAMGEVIEQLLVRAGVDEVSLGRRPTPHGGLTPFEDRVEDAEDAAEGFSQEVEEGRDDARSLVG
ncbi:MAG: hypothetical protein V9F04_16180 [Dermatophilaceae bacterium]